jgi:hypothetical protein
MTFRSIHQHMRAMAGPVLTGLMLALVLGFAAVGVAGAA